MSEQEPPACDYCNGCGRERDGGRCQNCGGNGMQPGLGLVGIHPKAAALRAKTDATMAARREKFGNHPKGCDGLRSGVCTCPAKP
jgi:hypothetical protein